MELESIIARVLQVLLALGGAYLIATWFVLVVWTYRDIESRSKNVVTQVFSTMLSIFFWIPGVLLYMMLRPKETLDEAYQRSLEEEYLLQDLQELPLCPTCNHLVHDEWQLCPHCNTQLREPCHNCGHLVDLRWDICPFCGQEQEAHEPHVHEREEPAKPTRDGWIDPDAIARRIREEHAERERTAPRALPAATAINRTIISPAADVLAGQDTASLENVGKVPVGPDRVDLSAGDGQSEEKVTIPKSFRLGDE